LHLHKLQQWTPTKTNMGAQASSTAPLACRSCGRSFYSKQVLHAHQRKCEAQTDSVSAQSSEMEQAFAARLWLARHGEKESESGDVNWDLRVVPDGVKLLQKNAALLAAADHQPLRVVSSPFPRCLQTAGVFAEALGICSVAIEPGLAEELTPARGGKGLDGPPRWNNEGAEQQLNEFVDQNRGLRLRIDSDYQPVVAPNELRLAVSNRDFEECSERAERLSHFARHGFFDNAILVSHGGPCLIIGGILTGKHFPQPDMGSFAALGRRLAKPRLFHLEAWSHDLKVLHAMSSPSACHAEYWSSIGLEPPPETVTVNASLGKLAGQLALRIRYSDVKCIAFDMDQTMCRLHSNGRLTSDGFANFAKSVMPDFIALARAACCLEQPLYVAVATASDRAEAKVYHPDCAERLLLGEDLVEPLLRYAVPELVDRFFVQAYAPDPKVHAEVCFSENQFKRRHIRNIADHFGINTSEILLIDDSVVSMPSDDYHCNVVPVLPVRGNYGMRLEQLEKWLNKKASTRQKRA